MPDTRIELADYATEYTIGKYKLVWRDKELWAIIDGPFNYNKDLKEWVYEPLPSNRDEEFKKSCRFGLLEAKALIEELNEGESNASKNIA